MALDGSGRGGGAAAGGDGPAPDKEFARGRRGAPPARTSKTGRGKTNENNDDNPSKRRTSLRITTGRKGRGAELTQRRGSLRKRDRSSQREAKLDAALVRRTVVLPEYVLVCGVLWGISALLTVGLFAVTIFITRSGPLTVSQLAEIIDEKPIGLIKFLMADLGVMASMTQSLDPSTCIAVVEGSPRRSANWQ